jgi:hypothetical protein
MRICHLVQKAGAMKSVNMKTQQNINKSKYSSIAGMMSILKDTLPPVDVVKVEIFSKHDYMKTLLPLLLLILSGERETGRYSTGSVS